MHKESLLISVFDRKLSPSFKAADGLAKHLLNKDSKTFWKEVKKVTRSNKSGLASTVGGACGPDSICDMWQKHYQDLLNSSSDFTKRKEVLDALSNLSVSDTVDRLTHQEIRLAIKDLKKGKSAGPDKLSSEHLIYSSNKLDFLLSMLFNAMIVHQFIPERFMDTTIIPLLKDIKGDITDKDNYRPIAITCIVSKVLELVILSKYRTFLESSNNQFGFKSNHSTDTCIYILKEIINY